MSKPIPQVSKFMTTVPEVIADSTPIATVHDLMRTKGFRHMPVCEGERVVGLLSDGDLYRAESSAAFDVKTARARDVMTPKPYIVSPGSPIDEVVQEMASKKYSSAVVVDNHKVVGIFTATDALHAFAELLHTRMRN